MFFNVPFIFYCLTYLFHKLVILGAWCLNSRCQLAIIVDKFNEPCIYMYVCTSPFLVSRRWDSDEVGEKLRHNESVQKSIIDSIEYHIGNEHSGKPYQIGTNLSHGNEVERPLPSPRCCTPQIYDRYPFTAVWADGELSEFFCFCEMLGKGRGGLRIAPTMEERRRCRAKRRAS